MAVTWQGVGSSTTELNQEVQTRPLHERIAIVTGSSRGIGRGIALYLASLGARIVVNYTSNLAQAESVAAQINSSSADGGNPRAIVVRADVSDPTQVKSLFDEAEKAFNSPVYILVNSAAIVDSKYPSVANTSLEDFDRTFRGAFLCCKEAASRLKRGGGGRIIMLSSSVVGSLRTGHGVYAASKAAVETMVKILAKELKGTGITANCVAPGPIATDMYFSGKSEEQVKKAIEESPLGRLGETNDVVPLVGFLASDAGEWVNGQVVRVNGGYV
ncbi:NADPH-dependent aldehyde reductase-like protein, chloroplastic [Prosopis cineraria]|uniref:NADPH-dependent aldehyde reductase-like protein, chloroplastic n=1 Tax=Prosopis cineraria TaxID=364024 RepID=UPI00240EF7A8|nr:NADPH-dependent aldehyde reductase-like protein, chloroplastic [Prosopis cineraria]